MYELIKRLRAVAGGGREEKCDSCPYAEDYPCCVDCLEKLHKQAADAIEELCNLCSDQSKLCSEAVAKYLELWEKQLRWIPVTERLPEPCVTVLICRHYYGVYDICFGHTLQINDYIPWSETNVTHWMPIPEPPKEGGS